jgi:hypothetical protein
MSGAVVPVWRRSSYSGATGENCVEVAGVGPTVLVRDSKDPNGPVLTLDGPRWRSLVASLKGYAPPAV